MADELNTPTHRYYQPRYNILLAPNEVSKQLILASGIRKIDNAVILPLFALAEPGVWYDPSDVANLAWRYNLLTYTEQFDNAIWTKAQATVTANGAIAPDGTTTADKLIASTANDTHYINRTVSLVGAHTLSAFFKASGYNRVLFGDGSGTAKSLTVDIQNGTIVSTGASVSNGSVQTVGNGWFRVSFTITDVLGFTAFIDNGSTIVFAGDGTSGVYLWGAQLELSTSSTASPYQRISDVNTEVMERFPKATLFQDSAGTTPVTTPGQTVGLMLDKSQGLVLGSELRGTGAIGLTGTATAATYNTTTGAATCFRVDASNQSFVTLTGLTSTATYVVTVTCTSAVVGMSVRAGSFSAAAATTLTAGQTKTAYVTGTTSITFTDSGSGCSFTVTSVKLLAGNHATQATSAQRPTYGVNPITGTRNLLTYTEQFDNAAWTKANATIVANSAVAPDGTLTADTLVSTTTNTAKYAFQSGLPSTVGTFTVYAKAAGETVVSLWFTGASVGAVFTLTGSGSTTLNGATYSSITAVGDGWYRCQVYYSSATTTAHIYLRNGSGFIGDGTSGILIWGAQLETGSTATAYQKVVSQYEVTEAGVQSVSYLAFDGVDDGMVTGTITPAIDKVQVFAGVRKLSDAAQGCVFELGVSAQNGSTSMWAPPYIGGGFAFWSKGTLLSSNAYTGSPASPATQMITGLGEISVDAVTLRLNGVQLATSSQDQGTGNYLAYPLYLGRRGGSTLPLNGRIYSLIVRFGANLTDGQITATEAWVNSKTGAY